MSGSSTPSFTGSNFIGTNYDLNKIFVRNNRYAKGTIANNTGAAATLLAGTVLAFNSATSQLVPWDNDNTANGQNIPVGILQQDLAELANGATQADVAYCVRGDVAEDKIIVVDGAQSLDTVIAEDGGRTLRNSLRNLQILPIESEDLTGVDN